MIIQVLGKRSQGTTSCGDRSGSRTKVRIDVPLAATCGTPQPEETKKIIVLNSSNRLGHGDDGLGEALLLNFLKTIKEMGLELWCLVMANAGVTLAGQGAAAKP